MTDHLATSAPHATDMDDEEQTRRIAGLRAKGMCEKCAQPGQLDAAHRVARSRGGPWTPANILMLCRACHQHNHQHPEQAYAGGWHLRTNANPTREPVLLFKQAQLIWALI